MESSNKYMNFYRVTYWNGGKMFSHIFHTKWRAEKMREEMLAEGCTNCSIYVYEAVLKEVV